MEATGGRRAWLGDHGARHSLAPGPWTELALKVVGIFANRKAEISMLPSRGASREPA